MAKKIAAQSISRSRRGFPLRFLPFALIFACMPALYGAPAQAQFSPPGPQFDTAIRENDYGEFRQCVIAGANANGKTLDGTPFLVYAAGLGRAQMVIELAENGARLGDRDREGDTALTSAVRRSHDDVATALLKIGADPDLDGARGETPLHIAAITNNRLLAQTLLAAKADPNLTDFTGRTPLAIAEERGSRAVAALLRQAGAGL